MAVVAGFGVLALIGCCTLLAVRVRNISWIRTSVFGPARRAYQIVRFPDLTRTVHVQEMILDVPTVPVFSKFCEELPVSDLTAVSVMLLITN